MRQKIILGMRRWMDDRDLVGLKLAVLIGLYIVGCCLEGWIL